MLKKEGKAMNTERSKNDENQANEKPQHANQESQEGWEGGNREPIHPDDIGADGKYLGADDNERSSANKENVLNKDNPG
jgi:hypothetical protein